jgi:hypothetical protein
MEQRGLWFSIPAESEEKLEDRMMGGSEKTEINNDDQKIDEIISSLQKLLIELDQRNLTMPAIKVAEAIDMLGQSSRQ